MNRLARLHPAHAAIALVVGIMMPASVAAMQDQIPGDNRGVNQSDSRIEAPQIALQTAPQFDGPPPPADQSNQPSKAFLDRAPDQAPIPRASLMQSPSQQLARANGSAPASQITAVGQSGSGIAQLSKSELEATLAQLSAAERRVLLQAIEGTDICDNPPQVAAVIALCQTRIETRSQEFSAMANGALSAEEQLLRGDADNTALPSVTQVIERLARSSAASDDFSNQAIASIALATPTAPEQPGEDELGLGQGLSEPTQALINAIINQLGGGAP